MNEFIDNHLRIVREDAAMLEPTIQVLGHAVRHLLVAVQGICDELKSADAPLAPTPPTPKVRPYTVAEFVAASKDLGRFITTAHNTLPIHYVRHDRVRLGCRDSGLDVRFDNLVDCTWADTGEPCGVKEPTP